MAAERSAADKTLELSKIPNYVVMIIGGTAYLVGVVGASMWVIFAGLGIVATNAAQESIRKK